MLIYLLIGVLIAQRFKVVVLVPVLVLAAVVAAAIGYRQHAGTWQLVGSTVTAVACLQVGYLAGAAIHYLAGLLLPGSILGRGVGGSISPRRTAH